MKLRVAINGYGVIGRRVADAVALQRDMEIAGVADIVTDWRTRVAGRRGFPLFAATGDALEEMKAGGFEPRGDLASLLKQADVAVNCTPKGGHPHGGGPGAVLRVPGGQPGDRGARDDRRHPGPGRDRA